MNTQEQRILVLGKITDVTAFAAMIIGTIILGTFFLLDYSSDVAVVGLIFMGVAFWAHISLLIILIFTLIFNKNHWQYLLIRMGILLLNIPISILYAFIGLHFLDHHN